MKARSIIPSLALGALAAMMLDGSSARAQAPSAPALQGTFKMIGSTCKSPDDMTNALRAANDDFRLGNSENVLQFQGNSVSSKIRSYKFRGYGTDHCFLTSKKEVRTEGKLMTLRLESRSFDATGRFDRVACQRSAPSTTTENFAFALQGDFLYLTPRDAKPDPSKCRQGPVHFVYKRTDKFELAKFMRPEKLEKEEAILKKLNLNPRSVPDLESYAVFLLNEHRSEEAEAKIDVILQVDSSNKLANEMKTGLKKHKAEWDLVKKRSVLAELGTRIAAAYLPPQMPTQVSGQAPSQATAPADRGTASQPTR